MSEEKVCPTCLEPYRGVEVRMLRARVERLEKALKRVDAEFGGLIFSVGKEGGQMRKCTLRELCGLTDALDETEKDR